MFRSTLARDQTVPGIDADREPCRARDAASDLGDESRVDRRRGTDHRAGKAQVQSFADQILSSAVRRRAAAAAWPPPAGDRPHDARVVSGAERAVQVHHMDPPGALLEKALRDRDGIVPINGLPRPLALAQTNDAAISNVDGGKEIHYSGVTAATAWRFQPPAGRSRPAEPGCLWSLAEKGSRRSRSCSKAARSDFGTGAPPPILTRRESLATPFIRNS